MLNVRFPNVVLILHQLHQLLLGIAEIRPRLETVDYDGALVVNSGGQGLTLDLSDKFFRVVREHLHLQHMILIKSDLLTCHFAPFFDTPRYLELLGNFSLPCHFFFCADTIRTFARSGSSRNAANNSANFSLNGSFYLLVKVVD